MKPAERTALAGLITLAACGPSGDSKRAGSLSSGEFTERDSAGVMIAVTSGSQAHAPLSWQTDTIPDIEIGVTGLSADESTTPWYTFHRVGGVRQLSDGRVVVADGGSREVRFFGSDGQFLRHVGRQGRGPGEFEGGPILVPSFISDSLVVFDSKPIRFHLISTNDDGFRFVRPATWKGATPPIGFVGPSVLVGLLHLYKPTTTGVYEVPATYAWTNIATGVRTLVDSFTVRPQYMDRFIGGVAYGGLIPFSAMPSATITRTGAFITEGVLPEIKEYDLDGRLVRIIRVDEHPRHITTADIQSYIAVTGRALDPDTPSYCQMLWIGMIRQRPSDPHYVRAALRL